MMQDGNDNNLMLNTIKKVCKNKSAIRIFRKHLTNDDLLGTITDFNQYFCMLKLCDDFGNFNGFSIIKISDITYIETGGKYLEKLSLIQCANKNENLLFAKLPQDISTFADIIQQINADNIIGLKEEEILDDIVFVGKVIVVNDNYLHLHASGYFDNIYTSDLVLNPENITQIIWGDYYLTALNEFCYVSAACSLGFLNADNYQCKSIYETLNLLSKHDIFVDVFCDLYSTQAITGNIVSCNDRYCVIKSFTDIGQFDGYQIVKTNNITRIRYNNTELKTIQKIAKKYLANENCSRKYIFNNINNFHSFLEQNCSSELIGLYLETYSEDTMIVGEIIDINETQITLDSVEQLPALGRVQLTISNSAIWKIELSSIYLLGINSVISNSHSSEDVL